jgi:hypothetical protein
VLGTCGTAFDIVVQVAMLGVSVQLDLILSPFDKNDKLLCSCELVHKSS